MEEKIKNFDRKIEQMMNENAVPPPFGMWNRISSGLGAEALPVAAPAPAALMPKRALVGLVSGALILGGALLITYLVNNNSQVQDQIVTNVPVEVITPEVKISEPEVLVIEETKPVVVSVKKAVVSRPAVQEKEVVKDETLTVTTPNYINHNEIGVPNQMLAQNTSALTDPYYFPPVDINNNETIETRAAEKVVEEEDVLTDVVEKKTKVSSASGHEKKLRPKKKKTGRFTYMKVNRYKEPK